MKHETDAVPPSPRPPERRVDPPDGEGLSQGAVHALRGEIAALRDVLSAMAVRGRNHQPAIAEAPPRYEEARQGEFSRLSPFPWRPCGADTRIL